jgi:hypothetical protein
LLAFAIATLVFAFFAPLFLVLWPAFYWGWDYLGRQRAAHGLRTLLWNGGVKSPAEHIAKARSGLRRVIRAIGFTMAALMVAGFVLRFTSNEFDKRKAREARATVQEGMTVGEVLHSMSAGAFLLANSDAPVIDPDHPPAVNLKPRSESQTFRYEDHEISESEALALLHRRLGDGYPWRFEFFFVGSLERFSFHVVFNRDGRVREVTPLYGSFE